MLKKKKYGVRKEGRERRKGGIKNLKCNRWKNGEKNHVVFIYEIAISVKMDKLTLCINMDEHHK